MCLGIPGELIKISNNSNLCPMGEVKFGALSKQICLAFVPEAKPGDYLLVHVGFAITIMDETEAKKIFETLDELEVVNEIHG